jgi:hypothetical protein
MTTLQFVDFSVIYSLKLQLLQNVLFIAGPVQAGETALFTSSEKFDELLVMIESSIRKQDTAMRMAIPPELSW